MKSDFGTQESLDKKIQKAAGVENEFPRKVFAQNQGKKGPLKVVIIGGGACGMAVLPKLEDRVILRSPYFHEIPILLTVTVESFCFESGN